eukprot:6471476-Prymnesium_polylepis.1
MAGSFAKPSLGVEFPKPISYQVWRQLCPLAPRRRSEVFPKQAGWLETAVSNTTSLTGTPRVLPTPAWAWVVGACTVFYVCSLTPSPPPETIPKARPSVRPHVRASTALARAS